MSFPSITTTKFEEKIFNKELLKKHGIRYTTLFDKNDVEALVKEPSTLQTLLMDLVEANLAEVVQLTQEEIQFLDYRDGDCNYILGQQFKDHLEAIPKDDEGEWIAECHNVLSHLFTNFDTWRAKSVISAAINKGVKIDRIFGFDFVNDFDASLFFAPWYNTGVRWPFLLVESKPQIYAKEIGDTWKMAIIQAFGAEQQIQVLNELKIPLDGSYYFNVHVPLTFGVYYVGRIVRISVYTFVNDQMHFIRIPELDLKTKAANVLKMFAIIKRWANQMHESVLQAFDENHWYTVPLDSSTNTENEYDNSNHNDKAEQKQIQI